MNYSMISSLVEKYRPLTGLSSLPFIISSGGGLNVRWFNYYLDQNGSKLVISIRSIFTVDESMKVTEIKEDIQLNVEIEDFNEPEMNEQEYLQLLASVSVDYSEDQMKELIAKAEMQPLLESYNVVIGI